MVSRGWRSTDHGWPVDLLGLVIKNEDPPCLVPWTLPVGEKPCDQLAIYSELMLARGCECGVSHGFYHGAKGICGCSWRSFLRQITEVSIVWWVLHASLPEQTWESSGKT